MVVDAEGQMARFVAITLRLCSGLVVLTYTQPRDRDCYCFTWRAEL